MELQEAEDNAYYELNIPRKYFTLYLNQIGHIPPREISPERRYLEILTEKEVIGKAAVNVYENGFVEGIYESLTGVYESLKRNNEKMVLFFAERLNEEALKILEEEFTSGKIASHLPQIYLMFRTKALRNLTFHLFGNYKLLQDNNLYPEEWEIYVEEVSKDKIAFDLDRFETYEQGNSAMNYLISRGKHYVLKEALYIDYNIEEIFLSVLRSGRVDFLNEILPLTLPLLPRVVNKVQDLILPLSFSPSGKYSIYKLKHTYRLPNYYFDAAVYGGNPQIYDYLRTISGTLYPMFNEESFISGYYAFSDPVGFYEILQRINHKYLRANVALNIDLAIYTISKSDNIQEVINKIVSENFGKIDFMFTFLPYVTQKFEAKGYPLTEEILDSE